MHGSPLDDSTVDRLLSGRLLPDDAPPGYANVAAALRAARAPRVPREQTVDDAVVRAAAAVAKSELTSPTAKGRTMMRRSFLPINVVAASAVGALGLATVAAGVGVAVTAGGSNHPAHRHATSAHVSGTPSATEQMEGSSTSAATTPTGPAQGIAKGQAMFGLCTALLAARGTTGTTPGKMATSVAFKTLLSKLGAATATTASTACTTYVATHKPGSSRTSTHPSASTHPNASTHPGATTHPGSSGTTHPSATTAPRGTSLPVYTGTTQPTEVTSTPGRRPPG